MPDDRKSKINEYIDTTGQFSGRQLRFGTWYLSHKVLLKEISLGILIAWCVVFVGFSFWKWGEYLFFGYWEDQENIVRQSQDFQNYTNIQSVYKAQDLKILETRVFPTSKNLFDFVSKVENQNENWVATITFHYTYSGGETEIQTAVMMPLSKRPVAAFGVESKSFPAGMSFVLDKVKWSSVDKHKIPNPINYLDERDNFVVDNLLITEPTLTGGQITSLSFDLINQSPYSFKESVFFVELLNGSQTVGYIYLYFDRFVSLQTENVKLNYFNETTDFNNIRIIPAINYFDDNIYIKPRDI